MSCFLTPNLTYTPKTPDEVLEDFIFCWGDLMKESDRDSVFKLRDCDLEKMEATVSLTQEETEYGFVKKTVATLKYSTHLNRISYMTFKLKPAQTQKP